MKRIIKSGLIGSLAMFLAFLIFAYAYGLVSRPDDMSILEAIYTVSAGTWNINALTKDILPILVPVGAILGITISAIYNSIKDGTKLV